MYGIVSQVDLPRPANISRLSPSTFAGSLNKLHSLAARTTFGNSACPAELPWKRRPLSWPNLLMLDPLTRAILSEQNQKGRLHAADWLDDPELVARNRFEGPGVVTDVYARAIRELNIKVQ